MDEPKFVFEVSDSTDALLQPLSGALKRRTEHASRARLPGLWSVTDRLNAQNPQGPGQKGSARSTGFAVLWMLLGVFLLIPGLKEPKTLFVPLAAGAFAIHFGASRLLLRRAEKRAERRFFSAAQALLDRQAQALGQAQVQVEFDGQGMTFVVQNAERTSKNTYLYADLEGIWAFEGGYLVCFDGRAAALKEEDLKNGMVEAFRSFLENVKELNFYPM